MQPNATNSAKLVKRQMALREWMAENEHTFQAYSNVFGITRWGTVRLLMRERMPVRRFEQLVSAFPEIPHELLPEPKNVMTGPKPKYMQQANV